MNWIIYKAHPNSRVPYDDDASSRNNFHRSDDVVCCVSWAIWSIGHTGSSYSYSEQIDYIMREHKDAAANVGED